MTNIEWTHNHMYSVGSSEDGFYLIPRGSTKMFFMKNLTGKFQEVRQIK